MYFDSVMAVFVCSPGKKKSTARCQPTLTQVLSKDCNKARYKEQSSLKRINIIVIIVSLEKKKDKETEYAYSRIIKKKRNPETAQRNQKTSGTETEKETTQE